MIGALAMMINTCGDGRNNEGNLNHALRYILLCPDSRKMMAENKGTLELGVRMIVPMNDLVRVFGGGDLQNDPCTIMPTSSANL